MLFCATCSCILIVEEYLGHLRYKCRVCPYTFNINKRISIRSYPKLKEIDDVLGGAAAWDNVDATDERCPSCSHPRAYFMQIQTRSADEPMTTFYKCCNMACGHRKYSKLAELIEFPRQNAMTKIVPVNSDSINLAVKLLQEGEVIAVPTDTVYGLAADSRNSNSVEALYNIKGRDFNKPIAICVGCVSDIPTWGNVSSLPIGLLEELLPGPVTVLLQRTNAISLKLNPGVTKIGIRIPDSIFIRDIAIKFGFAVALTSANLSNSSSTLDPNEFKELWIRLGAVFDGGTLGFSEASRAGSTIVDLSEAGTMMKSFWRDIEMRRRETSVKGMLTTELQTVVQSIQFEFTHEYEVDGDTLNSLCTVLEAVFIHGLKETFSDKMSSVLGGPDRKPTPEFWNLSMIFSHSEVIKQVTRMSQITTDIGRSRAWLRLSLNEGMITSYLMMISQDNSSLSPYYKRYAFLRDIEVLGLATDLLKGLARVPFNLPTNSSVLNTWSNTPLLLAGLWTPPMKEMPSRATLSFGMDIAQGLSNDFEKAETISSSSMPSSSGKYGEEEAFMKVLLGTPVEGSPIHSHLNLEESDEKNINDADQLTYEEQSDLSYLPVVTKCDEKRLEEPKDESEWKDKAEEKKVEEKENSTMQSYHKILDSYDDDTFQQPNIEDIINNFGVSDFGLAKQQPESMAKSPSSNDFVIVEQSSCNMNIPEFKSLVEQLGKIVYEKGLIEQNFSCKECRQPIGLTFAKACACFLTGCYYCPECFKSEAWPIPGRILHNWDFSPYVVCGKAAAFLQEVQEFPLFDVRRINPRLYLVFSEMSSLQKLRLQLNFLRIYLFTCRDSVKERVKMVLWPKEYLYEHVHLYSLTDLLDIPNGKLVDLMKRAIKMSVDHVLSCQLCSQKGYICELCDDDKTIYPFDIETTYRCTSCRTVYHLKCKKDKCPKCERIKKRKECAKSTSDQL